MFEGWFNGDAKLAAAFFEQRVLHAHNRATGTTTASNPLRGRRPVPKTKQVSEDNLLPKNANLILSFLSSFSYFSTKIVFFFNVL